MVSQVQDHIPMPPRNSKSIFGDQRQDNLESLLNIQKNRATF